MSVRWLPGTHCSLGTRAFSDAAEGAYGYPVMTGGCLVTIRPGGKRAPTLACMLKRVLRMAALPGLMQVEPLQAPATVLGALDATAAPAVLPEDIGVPAEVITHHSTDMPPLPAPLHAPAMRPGPSSAQGMDATSHMNPCQPWEALWLPSSAPIKLPKPSNPENPNKT